MKRFATYATVALIAGWIATGAKAASYSMSWTGSDGYSMTGSFSFSDALLGSTHVTETDLTTFEIQTFLNGGALNSWDYFNDGLSAGASMNFNFDAVAGTFRSGNYSNTDDGQEWNANIFETGCGTKAGFLMGNVGHGICEADNIVGIVPLSQATLPTAVLTTAPVPLPASVLLLGGALAGLGALRRRRS